jgi:hypothetical protein
MMTQEPSLNRSAAHALTSEWDTPASPKTGSDTTDIDLTGRNNAVTDCSPLPCGAFAAY